MTPRLKKSVAGEARWPTCEKHLSKVKQKTKGKGINNKDTNKRQNKENKKNDSHTACGGSLVRLLVLQGVSQ